MAWRRPHAPGTGVPGARHGAASLAVDVDSLGGGMRYAGMHWPTGGEHPDRETIVALPGLRESPLVMLADSARFHYGFARETCPLVVWRALPRQGSLPSQLGWDSDAVADECLNLWDEQAESHRGEEWFTPLNEIQFPFESGEDPFPGFAVTAERLGGLREALRSRFADRGQTVRLIFPAWCPDQPGPVLDAPFDAFDEWAGEAMRWDSIGAHIYSHRTDNPAHSGAANVIRTHDLLRGMLVERFGGAGRNKTIIYTEINANHTGVDERAMLQAAGRVCRDDPRCLGYAWYIWETDRGGEDDLSVFGNEARLALFNDPPPPG